MLKVALTGMAFTLLASVASFGQASGYQSMSVELANLHEDVRALTQKMGEMQLKLEQYEKENGDLRTKAAGAAQNSATVQQLNEAVADLNRAIKSSAASTKTDTLQQVSVQMEKLIKQVNASIDAVNKSNAAPKTPASPISAPQFTDDYPKEGITYTVQKGDTLSGIAKKTGGKAKDILNANKLSDSSKIYSGQTLFIPGGK